MRKSSRPWVGVAFLCLALSAFAQAPPEPASKGDYGNGKDFRLTPIEAKDADGKPITDVPAVELGFRDTDGVWEEFNPPSAVTTAIPKAMRPRVMLVFYGGWSLVPRGWKVSHAMLSADTTLSIGFEAPGGPQAGWMNDGMVACSSCAEDEAAPYFARARQEIHEEYGDDWKLPRADYPPLHLTRPDGCTVIFDYRMPRSPLVHAWMNYVGVQYGVLDAFDIAMPDVDRDLRDLIFADHTQNPQKCVARQDRTKG